MTEMKYLSWLAILILLIVMILMLFLDYAWLPLLLLIPVIFNLIIIVWAKSLEKQKHNDSYIYHLQTIFFFLISLIAFVPSIFVLTAIPHLIERFPEYYSKENRIERRLDKLAKKRFERFKDMEAPIHSGIWVEQHEMERPYDFNGIYVVPCINGQIHGEVQMLYTDNWEKVIYFNQGQIDSIYFQNEERTFTKSYRQEDGDYLRIEYNEDNNMELSIDTVFIERNTLETHFWQQ